MNRGSDSRGRAADRLHVGFNEAPIHESGKSSSPARFRARARCFNEAPIHESGKYRSRWPFRSGQEGFNEAPIHESGKFWLRFDPNEG